MMAFIFLVLWTTMFFLSIVYLIKRQRGASRIYVLILVNMVYLSGVFTLYPLLLSPVGRG